MSLSDRHKCTGTCAHTDTNTPLPVLDGCILNLKKTSTTTHSLESFLFAYAFRIQCCFLSALLPDTERDTYNILYINAINVCLWQKLNVWQRRELFTQQNIQWEMNISGGNLSVRGNFRSFQCLHLQLKHIDRAMQIDVH